MRKLALSCPLIPLSSSARRLVFSHPVIPSVLCFQQTPLPLFLFLFCIVTLSKPLCFFSEFSLVLFSSFSEVQCAARKMKWSMSIGGEDAGGWVTAVSGTRPREKDKNSEKEREKLMA